MKKFAILITLLVVFLSGCNISNQKLAKKMIEKYSDNQNLLAKPFCSQIFIFKS